MNYSPAEIELIRRQSWSDFYVFAKYVVGKNLMEELPHRELCEFMTYGLDRSSILGIDGVAPPMSEYVITECRGTLKKLMQLPRNSFKSSVAQALIPWLLWHNQNLRIMIDSETLANAKLYLAGIKDVLDNNEMLRLICVNEKGEYLLEPNKKLGGGFVEDQVILLHRTKVGLKEPSIFCSGVDNARTGMHPDVIMMDDLVSERNVATAAQIQKVEEHYKYSLSLLEIGGGLLLVIGTRYHMNDLYGHLIESKALDTLIRPAIADDGTLYFPTRLTHEFLREMRTEQGSYIYSCQYMLNPINPEDAIFKKEHLQYIEDLSVAPKITKRYITVDPAISQNERADFTVFLVTGVDEDNNRYYEKLYRGKFTPYELIDKLFAIAATTPNLSKVGVEVVAFQKMLMYAIRDEMKRRGVYLPLQELKADTDKVRRARKIQPYWEQNKCFLSMIHCRDLEKELFEFPLGAHDDTVDCAAYVEQLIRPNYKRASREYKAPSHSGVTGY